MITYLLQNTKIIDNCNQIKSINYNYKHLQ